ncbi:hypothetical protein [Paraburkholderia silvatlantica]|uniref:Ribbon-helix-helix CopG family protein n=1 Tax=Paraburkholderia silvatlantica TaxID=321895 RepID=A0ABR6FPL5_9BURK|nr:hypothetical protein [Paraburkholderia silvatlantica]MBB2929359.1 hypothetical protein [Paraburkholderia silvatlantica]PVY35949.1 hypothetical protein C7411_104290 [Paraburkholderia silvatlantica]PXW39897.1 hypothetical protein C7413_105241 [Paraburkholderia silvatlantica]
MNKPSERIVVFVTPAQKRAISATADELGISISELMRRAVIAFSATSDQVKAASIVDRLNAPRQPDALAQVLQKAAKPLRAGRAGAIRPPTGAGAAAIGASAATSSDAQKDDALADSEAAAAIRDDAVAPLPAAHTDEADVSHAAREIAQAVARLSAESAAAAQSAALDTAAAQSLDAEPLQPLSSAPFARSRREASDPRDEASSGDAAPEGGKYA